MRILVAEDNPISQTMLGALLTKWGYEVVLAMDGDTAWHVLQSKNPPRLAILDWMIPGIDGVEICRRMRAPGQEPYVYILLLSGRTSAQDLVEGLDAGADDYLAKPFNSSELRARLRAGRRIIELHHQLLIAQEALRLRATHDGLTGLLNRSSIMDTLRNELERATHNPRPVSLLMIDFDHFKQINDTYGHLAGDAVLRDAAGRMREALRSTDSLGRYGGEEFLIVLPGCSRTGAQSLAERLRAAISAMPFRVGEIEVKVTCSIGYASQPPGLAADADSLLRLTDCALYEAKRGGRNRTEAAEAVLMAL